MDRRSERRRISHSCVSTRQALRLPERGRESRFRASALAVLERAYDEARASFRDLAALGFWFPEELADEVVHAIVGLEGVRRMEELAAGSGGP
jgi:hypothetical protein